MVLLLHLADHKIVASKYIYIPIWCYFYVMKECNITYFIKFTFQYGATSTISIYSTSFLLFLFTFQYGATSTNRRMGKNGLNRHLHSNMVLLLPFFNWECKIMKLIYIPIWCYFYQLIFLIHLPVFVYLHSNMVLLLLIYFKMLLGA